METKTDTSKAELSREEEIKIQVVRSFLEDLSGVFRDVFEPFGDILQLMESPEFAKKAAENEKARERTNRTGHSFASNHRTKRERAHKRSRNGTATDRNLHSR